MRQTAILLRASTLSQAASVLVGAFGAPTFAHAYRISPAQFRPHERHELNARCTTAQSMEQQGTAHGLCWSSTPMDHSPALTGQTVRRSAAPGFSAHGLCAPSSNSNNLAHISRGSVPAKMTSSRCTTAQSLEQQNTAHGLCRPSSFMGHTPATTLGSDRSAAQRFSAQGLCAPPANRPTASHGYGSFMRDVTHSVTAGLTDSVASRLIFWNLYGYKNLDDISSFVNGADILCVCETWLTVDPSYVPSPFSHFVSSPAIKSSKYGRASGGLIIFYDSKKFRFDLIDSKRYFITCRIFNETIEFILCFIYIPPNNDIQNIINDLEENILVLKFNYPELPIYLGGDFNCRIGDLNSSANLLSNSLFFLRESLLTRSYHPSKAKC